MSAAKKLKHEEESPEEHRPHEEEHHHAEEGEEGWLVSYADMMTLLCGFFIILFSMSKLEEPKYDAFKEAVAGHFNGKYKSPQKELAKFVTQVLQELNLDKEVLLKSEHGGVTVIFQSTLFFDTLSSDVNPQGIIILSRLIDAIAAFQRKEGSEYRVVVEGHTDTRPIMSGIYPSNWELSAARASRVVRMFMERGFAPDRLTAIGYGDTRPVASERNSFGELVADSMAKNRRVAIRILLPTTETVPIAPPEAETPISEPPAEHAPPPAAVAAPGTPAAPAPAEFIPLEIPADSAH